MLATDWPREFEEAMLFWKGLEETMSEDERHFYDMAIHSAEHFGMQYEIMLWAYYFFQSDAKATVQEAFDYALKEWIK